MGKTHGWMHSIKKAIHNHVHGDVDPDKFQHLQHVIKPSSDHRTSSTASSHVDEHHQHRRPSTSSVGGSGHHEHSLPKEEKGRSSTSSQVGHGGSSSHHHVKSHTSDKDKRRASTSSQNGGSGLHTYDRDDSSQHGSGSHKSSHRSDHGSGHHKHESSTPRDRSSHEHRSDRENGSSHHRDRDDTSSHRSENGSSHHRDRDDTSSNSERERRKSSSSHRDERERGSGCGSGSGRHTYDKSSRRDDYSGDSSHLQRDERESGGQRVKVHRESGEHYHLGKLLREGSGEHHHIANLHREGSGDHDNLLKLYHDERGSGTGGNNPFFEKSHKEEKRRSSTSSERRYGFHEESASDRERRAPRHTTHSDRGGERSHKEEKGRSSTSSQTERSLPRHGHPEFDREHETSPVEKHRSSTSSTHNDRTVLEKARSSTSSNHHRGGIGKSSSEKARSLTPSSPDNRTGSLLISMETPSPSDRRRSSSGAGAASPRHHQHAGNASPRHHQIIDKASSEKLRPKTPSSPRMVLLDKTQSDKSSSRSTSTGPAGPVPAAASNASSHHQEKFHHAAPSTLQIGRNIALQDLLKPPSFERKSSSSSTMSLSQVGGSFSARSFTSEGSLSSSDDYVEMVFPQPERAETRAAPPVKTIPSPPSMSASQNQRKKVAIATIKEVFSLQEYDAPLSPGSQRRKSANFTPKAVVPLPELGTKSLLPPDYRKQQPAHAVADMPAVIFQAGDSGVRGMLGEWAAITIQSSWRGFAARVAFRALKGLVRLQALARGYLVRRKITPLVKARIQAARVRIKLSRNSKVHHLHPIQISNTRGYGIAQIETQTPSQYGFAQPVLDDSPTSTRGHSAPLITLKAFM